MPGQVTLGYNPARTLVEESFGTNFTDGDVVDQNGTANGDVHFILRPHWNMKLLFLAGFRDAGGGTTHVGTLTYPKPVTLEFMRAGQSFQHAGAVAKHIKIVSNQGAMPLVTITYDGLKKPVPIEPSAPSGITALLSPATDHPFAWRDFGSATILAGGAGATSIDTFELDIELNTAPFYGNNSDGMPSDMILGAGQVSLSFQRLFKDIAEYDRFSDSVLGQQGVPFSFGWAKGSHSVRLDMPAGVYMTHTFKQDLKAPITESFTAHALTPGGAVPLTLTVTNTHAAAYTST